MDWMDIVCILFTCTAANHLGLVGAVEGVAKREIPIVNCPKCLTFWVTLVWGLFFPSGEPSGTVTVMGMLAISFLNAYLAIWLELLMGFIDTLYLKVYEKVYSGTADNETAADSDAGHSAGSLPVLR